MTVCIKYLINVFRAHKPCLFPYLWNRDRGCPHSLINNPRSLAKVMAINNRTRVIN